MVKKLLLKERKLTKMRNSNEIKKRTERTEKNG